jgi:hypothetical protein
MESRKALQLRRKSLGRLEWERVAKEVVGGSSPAAKGARMAITAETRSQPAYLSGSVQS